MPELILHAGSVKTGSSSIQHFLAVNTEILIQSGIGILSLDYQNQSKEAVSNIWALNTAFRDYDAGDALSLTRLANNILAQIDNSSNSHWILSAENLLEERHAIELVKYLSRETQVSTTAYIRSQPDILISAWLQWEMRLGLDLAETIGMYLQQDRFNWLSLYQRWLGILQESSLSFNIYDIQAFPEGDVCKHFIAHLDKKHAFNFNYSTLNFGKSKHGNYTVDPFIYRFSQGENFFSGIHDNRFIEMLDFIWPSACTIDKELTFIKPDLVTKIRDHYRISNSEISRILGFDTSILEKCNFNTSDDCPMNPIGKGDCAFYMELARRLAKELFKQAENSFEIM